MCCAVKPKLKVDVSIKSYPHIQAFICFGAKNMFKENSKKTIDVFMLLKTNQLLPELFINYTLGNVC